MIYTAHRCITDYGQHYTCPQSTIPQSQSLPPLSSPLKFPAMTKIIYAWLFLPFNDSNFLSGQPIQLIEKTIDPRIRGLDLISLVLFQGPVAGTLSPVASVDCACAVRACAPRARPTYCAALCWAQAVEIILSFVTSIIIESRHLDKYYVIWRNWSSMWGSKIIPALSFI